MIINENKGETMKLEPLGDRIVIKPNDPEEKMYGNIIIPDTAKEKPQSGTVVSVGNDEEVTENLKVGDTIIYAKYGGSEITIENEEFVILNYSDVLAKVVS